MTCRVHSCHREQAALGLCRPCTQRLTRSGLLPALVREVGTDCE